MSKTAKLLPADPQTIKVWITKYALTAGTFTAEAVVEEERMISVRNPGEPPGLSCYHKPHWHTTEADALERVRKMARANLASISKAYAAAVNRLKELEAATSFPDKYLKK